MIYIVDEDTFQMRPYATALQLDGYLVTQIDNADTAYDVLSVANDIQMIVLDVMLATADKDQSRFAAEDTDNFLRTGLLLLRWLIDLRGRDLAVKCVLFSMASQPPLVSSIRHASREFGVPFWQKKDFSDPLVFAKQIRKIVAT